MQRPISGSLAQRDALRRAGGSAWPRRSLSSPRRHRLAVHAAGDSRRFHARALCAAPELRSHEAAVSINNTKNTTSLDGELRPVSRFFELEMSVRDCELDQYGVVNNAVYASYVQRARDELAAVLGVSACTIACTGNSMAVSEQNLKYLTPLKRGAKFVVKVAMQVKGARIYAEQFIETLPDHKLVLEATATIVCLNRECRPIRVFPDVSSKLLDYFSRQEGQVRNQD